MTISAKKDGLVNMGGFIALNNKEVFKQATVFNIMYEGFITYGGMNGRDMGALAVGLDEATEFNYLESRVEQVAHLGKKLVEYKVPVLQPFGGHAIFLDAINLYHLFLVKNIEPKHWQLNCILLEELEVLRLELF